MLYGQNLPWRLALRNTSRAAGVARYSSSGKRLYSTSRRFLISASTRPAIRSFAPVTQSFPGSSNFSTSPARRKDDESEDKKAKNPVEEILEEDNKEQIEVKEVGGENTVEAKIKSPEPASQSGNVGSPAAADENAASPPAGSAGDAGSGDGGKKAPKTKALSKPSVPDVYPQVMAIPITKRPLFPGFYKAVTVRNPEVVAAIQEMMKRGQPYIGAFLFKEENVDSDVIESVDDVHDVGTFAQITSAFPVHGSDALTLVLYPHRRIRMSSMVTQDRAAIEAKKVVPQTTEPPIPEVIPPKPKEDGSADKKGDIVASFEEGAVQQKTGGSPPLYDPTSFLHKYAVSLVKVENLTEEPHDPKSPIVRAVTNEIVNVFKEVAGLNQLFRDQISTFSMSQSAGNVMQEPAKLADFAAAVSAGEVDELQDVLEELNVENRLQKALMVLKKELMNAKLQAKISKDVEKSIQKRQREYWLLEQMKGIRKELGIESDGKDKLVEKFREKGLKLAMPEAVKKVFDEELNKLAHLEQAASEFNVTRNYLDWLTQIPWGQRSAENFGIKHAMDVLDEDHHGLKDVKDRILEFIAVGKLRGDVGI